MISSSTDAALPSNFAKDFSMKYWSSPSGMSSTECFEEDGALYVPIDLPPHAEYDAVLKAVGRRLQEVSDLISAAGGAAGL